VVSGLLVLAHLQSALNNSLLLYLCTHLSLLTTVQIYACIFAKSLKTLKLTAARLPYFDESLLFFRVINFLKKPPLSY